METLIGGLILWSGISVVALMFVLIVTVGDGGFLHKIVELRRNPKKEMNIGFLLLFLIILPLVLTVVVLFAAAYVVEILYTKTLQPILSIKLFKGE